VREETPEDLKEKLLAGGMRENNIRNQTQFTYHYGDPGIETRSQR